MACNGREGPRGRSARPGRSQVRGGAGPAVNHVNRWADPPGQLLAEPSGARAAPVEASGSRRWAPSGGSAGRRQEKPGGAQPGRPGLPGPPRGAPNPEHMLLGGVGLKLHQGHF